MNAMSAVTTLSRCVVAVGVLLVTFQGVAAVAEDGVDADPAIGTWATPGFGSKVRIEQCEQKQGELCGTVVWLWDALEESGEQKMDRKNPDVSRRDTPVIGVQILSDFSRRSEGAWAGGKVYNPDDGRLYSATIRVEHSGILELKGCALRVFCQTQIWRRVEEVCGVADHSD